MLQLLRDRLRRDQHKVGILRRFLGVIVLAAGNVDETVDGMKSDTFDPTYTELLSSTWKTVYTPPKPPNGPWDSTAVFAQGKVSYVAMCSVCRPSLATASHRGEYQSPTKALSGMGPAPSIARRTGGPAAVPGDVYNRGEGVWT